MTGGKCQFFTFVDTVSNILLAGFKIHDLFISVEFEKYSKSPFCPFLARFTIAERTAGLNYEFISGPHLVLTFPLKLQKE